jgi:hypothetical protein
MNFARIIKYTSALIFSVGTSAFVHPSQAQSECITTEDGRTVCGKPSKKQSNAVIVDDFKFSLKGCKNSGSILKCEFTVNNTNEAPKILEIFAYNFVWKYGSKVISNTGKTYYASSIEFDGNKETLSRAVNLTPGIDYSGVLMFENMPNINKVQILKIDISTKVIQEGQSSPEFRNVSVE